MGLEVRRYATTTTCFCSFFGACNVVFSLFLKIIIIVATSFRSHPCTDRTFHHYEQSLLFLVVAQVYDDKEIALSHASSRRACTHCHHCFPIEKKMVFLEMFFNKKNYVAKRNNRTNRCNNLQPSRYYRTNYFGSPSLRMS